LSRSLKNPPQTVFSKLLRQAARSEKEFLMKKPIIISLVILIVTAVLITKYHDFFSILDQRELHIAVIGPMTGPQESVGFSLAQGAELYINQLNKKGGINHHKVVLDIFDDQNNPEIARQKALEIVKDKQVLAVIGHNFSSCSIAAGEVYKNQLPAITPSSTNVQVTVENDWYFRTIYRVGQEPCGSLPPSEPCVIVSHHTAQAAQRFPLVGFP
jgi:ABC-type branched-subunit amino acid transport system substrate-binding protein